VGWKSMKLSTFISIHAVLLFIFGLGFLLFPSWLLSVYGTSTNSTGLLTARVFGIGNIQLSIIMWVSRNDIASSLLNTLLILLFIGNVLAFILALNAQVSGVFNGPGWTNVILYLFFGIGYGYFLYESKVRKIH
jgi:hypothetical protein